MPKTSDMRDRKFLSRDDVGPGVLLTVAGVVRLNVARDDAPPELHWCMQFVEQPKPLILRSTTIQLCEEIFASDNSDDWTGRQLVVYVDPTIQFQGRARGGIRVRAARQQAAAGLTPANDRIHPAPVVPDTWARGKR